CLDCERTSCWAKRRPRATKGKDTLARCNPCRPTQKDTNAFKLCARTSRSCHTPGTPSTSLSLRAYVWRNVLAVMPHVSPRKSGSGPTPSDCGGALIWAPPTARTMIGTSRALRNNRTHRRRLCAPGSIKRLLGSHEFDSSTLPQQRPSYETKNCQESECHK